MVPKPKDFKALLLTPTTRCATSGWQSLPINGRPCNDDHCSPVDPRAERLPAALNNEYVLSGIFPSSVLPLADFDPAEAADLCGDPGEQSKFLVVNLLFRKERGNIPPSETEDDSQQNKATAVQLVEVQLFFFFFIS
jgi:hypothetical protein